jgi:hypothetical protein
MRSRSSAYRITAEKLASALSIVVFESPSTMTHLLPRE